MHIHRKSRTPGRAPHARPLPASRLALALAACYPAMGGAQGAEPARPLPVLPEVEVSGEVAAPSAYQPPPPRSPRFTQPLLDTPQTVNVVPQAVIEQRGATTLRDVLRNVPGISMQAGEGGTPAGDQLSVRGFSARTDIFVDNVRDFGGYARDPFNVEQVEVVKGPSSDYSGRGSTGGSINLVSKTPYLDDFLGADVTFGTDAYKRTTLDVNHVLPGLENAAARVNLMVHDQEVAGRDVVENQRFGVAPSLSFGIGTPTELTLSLFHMEQDNVPDYGIPWVPATNVPLARYANRPAPVDFDNWYGIKDRDHENVRTTLATAELEHAFSEHARVRNLTRWGETTRDSLITAPRFLSDAGTDIRRSGTDVKSRDQDDAILANLTDFTFEFGTGTWEHTLLAGVELAREDQKNHTRAATGPASSPANLYDPDPDDPYTDNIRRTGGKATSDADSVAAYLADSIDLNEQWQVNAGLRWDHFEFAFTPDGGAKARRTDVMWSYRGGVVYKPVPHGSLYAGYGTSFNPGGEGLVFGSGASNLGIEDLAPEKNRSFEVGTKWELLARRLFASAALFRTDKTNARTQDPDDPADLVVLEGEQRVEGVELGLAGSLTPVWAVYAGYTYLASEILESKAATEEGNDLPNAPRHSFNLWTTYDVLPAVQLGFGALYVDSRYSAAGNTREAPDYWIYEAMASWRVTPTFSLRVNAQNLTDKEYIDYVGGGHFIPGVGRTVLLTASFDY